MNKYESVIIVKPTLKTSEIITIIEKVDNAIKKVADITEKQELGLKKLAYEVKGNKEGYYLVYEFEVNEGKKEDAIREIEHFYRITDEIIKFIIVERD